MSDILLIDNLDSFTFNLVESFERLGHRVRTVRNSIAAASALKLAEERQATIVISPGPGRPEHAGCCLDVVRLARGKRPLIGICLGHQAILVEARAKLVSALEPVHGKASAIDHDGQGPFAGMPSPLRVGRYHSLGVQEVPERFHVHARIDGMAMAISDRSARQVGLQFHPESILTREGDRILQNGLNFA